MARRWFSRRETKIPERILSDDDIKAIISQRDENLEDVKKRTADILEAAKERAFDMLEAIVQEQDNKPLEKPKTIQFKLPSQAECERLAEYEAQCREVGIDYPMFTESKLERFFVENSIPVYDEQQVKTYMDATIECMNRHRIAQGYSSRYYWYWRPLRETDVQRLANERYQSATWSNIAVAGWGGGPGTLSRSSQTMDPTVHLTGGPIDISSTVPAGTSSYVLTGPSSHYSAPTWINPVGEAYPHLVPGFILKRCATILQAFPDALFEVTDYDVINPDPFISFRVGKSKRYIFGHWDEPGF